MFVDDDVQRGEGPLNTQVPGGHCSHLPISDMLTNLPTETLTSSGN
jgi:hypothetical protein